MAPLKLLHFGQLKAAVYSFQQLYTLVLYRLRSLTFTAADDVRLCNVCGLVDNYHEREIKYEGFSGIEAVCW